MIVPSIPVSVIAAFSLDGHVFRAFDHLVAAGVGELLFVPQALAQGDLRGVVDRCPVPWDEVWAVLDTPLEASAAIDTEAMAWNWPRLYQMCRGGWQLDRIGLGGSAGERKALDRLTHVSGVRFAQIHPSN